MLWEFPHGFILVIGHLINGDFVVDYYTGIESERVAEQISIGKYILLSYPIFILVGVIFTLMLWIPCVLSLWLWSKVRTMQITFYEYDGKEI